MRITICNLDLVSKHENNKMKISISSRQVTAINIIFDLVSKNCTFFHITHDILKSSYMMLHNIFSEAVDGTPTKESEVLPFLVIFSICAILLIYLIETAPVKNHSLVWQYFGKAKCKACCKEILCTPGTPGSDKNRWTLDSGVFDPTKIFNIKHKTEPLKCVAT